MIRPWGGSPGFTQEGQEADEAVAGASRSTSSRRELAARHEAFEQVSPDVGVLDESALDGVLTDDPDEALSLLADLTGATDPVLRELARRLAGKIVVDLARSGRSTRRGVGRLEVRKLPETGGDLDVDASMEGLLDARASRRPARLDDLRGPHWIRPGTALCLVVDRSGSMGGQRLATAAVAAAAVAWRNPDDHSVVAFSKNAIVIKAQDSNKSPARVVEDLLTLRGHGTTDVALALQTARQQLERSHASRRICVLLSDCRATEPGDARGAARGLDELFVIAPEGDSDDAEALAADVGALCVTIGGPADIPQLIARLLPG